MTSSRALFYNKIFLNANPEDTQFYKETMSPLSFYITEETDFLQ